MSDILYLKIKKQYFDQIASGKKKIEYRSYTPYYYSRLRRRKYRFIKFVNGYAKNSDYLIAEFVKVRKYMNNFLIYIGEIIEVNHAKQSRPGKKTKTDAS